MGVLATAAYRNIRDSNLTTTSALPTAASTITQTAWDTGDNTDGIFPERVELEVAVPSTGNLVSGAILTFTVLADTANPPTTVLSPSLTFTVTGTAGNGAATTVRWRVPANCGRYLAIKCLAGTSGAGDNSAVSYTSRLLF